MKRFRAFSLALTCMLAFVLYGSGQAQAPVSESPEIPLPPIRTSLGSMPGPAELPVRREMPDVMVMNDGTRVKTREQWSKRREEIKRILSYYAVGQMPPAPGNVKGREIHIESVLDGKAKYR